MYVNPTPEVRVDIPDTLICNDTDISFSVNSMVSTLGTLRYHLDVEYPAGVTGDLTDGEYNTGNLLDHPVNADNDVQEITYYFKAFIEGATKQGRL